MSDMAKPTWWAPEEVKEKWLAALRSGEYKQAKQALYDEDTGGYCCLGVLQHVLDGEVECNGKGAPAGVPTLKWLDKKSIQFQWDGVEAAPSPFLPTLSRGAITANDDGLPFLEIADALEACYGGPIGARSEE